MSIFPDVPHSIMEAFAVAQEGLNDAALQIKKTEGIFEIKGRISYNRPDNCSFPALVPVRIELRPAFPHAPPSIYFEHKSIAGYPHQRHSGLICPPQDGDWNPSDGRDAMKQILQHMRCWLSKAAASTLIQTGEPYELPDFWREHAAPVVLCLHAAEEEQQLRDQGACRSGSLETWKTGDFVYCLGPILADRPNGYQGRDSSLLASASKTLSMLGKGKTQGWWLYVPRMLELPPKRPPETFGDLWQFTDDKESDVKSSLEEVLRHCEPQKNFTIGLIGFPIPKYMGEKPTSIHWQTVKLPIPQKTNSNREHRIKSALIRGQLSPGTPLQWLPTHSLAPEQFFARTDLRYFGDCHVVIFGCGALGCVIAELLARAGVGKFTLVDNDKVEPGNLCRHILTILDVGKSKAQALGCRLKTIHPGIEVDGGDIDIFALSAHTGVLAASLNAHLWIDTTGSRNAVKHLADLSRGIGMPLATAFITYAAEYLHLYISAPNSGIDVAEMESRFRIAAEEQMASNALKKAKAAAWDVASRSLIFPEPGCYHPTFPASCHDMWVLGSIATDIIIKVLTQEQQFPLGLVIRRPSVLADATTDGIVIWRDLPGAS